MSGKRNTMIVLISVLGALFVALTAVIVFFVHKELSSKNIAAAHDGDNGAGIAESKEAKRDASASDGREPAGGGAAAARRQSDFTETAGGVNIDMVLVKGGAFMMGCTPEQESDCDDDERPPHRVDVDDFYIGKYEVTQRQWREVTGRNPSHFKGDNLPVESVSWDDVQEFIGKLNSMTGKNYRLPTEAEWEYAARGGGSSKGYKYAGGNDIDEVGWHEDNAGSRTRQVGAKRANELGLYDMAGNVWEWVNDRYGSYSGGAKRNPKGAASGVSRVIRGGPWLRSAESSRVSNRGYLTPDNRRSIVGVRLALSP